MIGSNSFLIRSRHGKEAGEEVEVEEEEEDEDVEVEEEVVEEGVVVMRELEGQVSISSRHLITLPRSAVRRVGARPR